MLLVLVGSKAEVALKILQEFGYEVCSVSSAYVVASVISKTPVAELWTIHQWMDTEPPFVARVKNKLRGSPNLVIADCLDSKMVDVIRRNFSCTVIGVGGSVFNADIILPIGELHLAVPIPVPSLHMAAELVDSNKSNILELINAMMMSAPRELVVQAMDRHKELRN